MEQPGFREMYVNERFGQLFTLLVQSFNISQIYLADRLVDVVGTGKRSILSDFAQYRQGNLLGQKQRLTRNSLPGALERDIDRLLDKLFAMGVPEGSEMLEIITNETGLSLEYPREIKGEPLSLQYEG